MLLEDWIRVYEAYGFQEVASFRLAKLTNAFFAPFSKPILEISSCFTYIRKYLKLKKSMRTNPDFDIDLGSYFKAYVLLQVTCFTYRIFTIQFLYNSYR